VPLVYDASVSGFDPLVLESSMGVIEISKLLPAEIRTGVNNTPSIEVRSSYDVRNDACA